MEPKLVYVSKENKATIVCDSCGKCKTANVARYLHLQQPIKIKCSCGHQILVRFETRQTYRKKGRLYGTCFRRGMKEEHIYIENLSSKGVGFETGRKDIRKGDTLKIKFVLDDSTGSEISEDVVVSHADDGHIGANFATASEHTRKVLGFYLS
ncbi:MAG: hypothetical protein BAW33_04795 [Desulfobacterales bacterium C00003104]|nr:MAG: hypothetical protein BAW33_04795 [Desulfobacterales bacterium C00003104]